MDVIALTLQRISQPGISKACFGNNMALGFPKKSELTSMRHALEYDGLEFRKTSQPGVSEACSSNIMASSFSTLPRRGVWEVYCGNVMAMCFLKASQPDTSEACSGNVMVMRFPKLFQPGISLLGSILWQHCGLGLSKSWQTWPPRAMLWQYYGSEFPKRLPPWHLRGISTKSVVSSSPKAFPPSTGPGTPQCAA